MVFVVVTATVGLLTGSTQAGAVTHHALVSSSPSNGSMLDTAPTSITMVFAEDVPELSIAVALTGPDGNDYALGSPEVNGTTVTQHFAGLTVAGEYALAYRIVVPQGPVGDVIRFSVGHGAAKEALAQEPGTTAGAQPPAPSTSGIPLWLWGGLLAVAIAVTVTAMANRRRAPRSSGRSGSRSRVAFEHDRADHRTAAVTGLTSSRTRPR